MSAFWEWKDQHGEVHRSKASPSYEGLEDWIPKSDAPPFFGTDRSIKGPMRPNWKPAARWRVWLAGKLMWVVDRLARGYFYQ